VGVVSFGIGCAQADYSGVNARVEAVITGTEWIDDQICELSDFPPASCFSNTVDSDGTVTTPTLPPDVLPSGGQFDLTIHVVYDQYPEETALALTYLDMADGDPLQLILSLISQSDIDQNEERSQDFTNLPSGTYSLQFGDQAGDGRCCGFGQGNVWVSNERTGGNTIWSNDGNYAQHLELKFKLNGAGGFAILQEDYDYDNTWEAFTAVNHPPTSDEEWPGAMPTNARFSAAINVKFDAFPDENSWTFYWGIRLVEPPLVSTIY
jgi:hypothetical protein